MTPAGKRWTAWAVLAVATGYAALQVSGDDPRRTAPTRADASDAGSPGFRDERPRAPEVRRMLAELGRSRLTDAVVGHPFASDSWAPRAPEKPKAVANPPPFGYAYGGRFEDANGAHVYLMRGNDLIPVERGDKLDGGYEVAGVKGDWLELIWLPGKRKVSLSLSGLAAPAIPGAPRTSSAGGVGSTVAALERSAGGATSPPSDSAGGQADGIVAIPFGAPLSETGVAQAASSSVASSAAALGSAPARSGVLGSPPANLPPIGSAPRGTGMTMLPAPTSPMPMLPAPTGKLGN
jgi:hypothetical protein